jgi:hypothetical protein
VVFYSRRRSVLTFVYVAHFTQAFPFT